MTARSTAAANGAASRAQPTDVCVLRHVDRRLDHGARCRGLSGGLRSESCRDHGDLHLALECGIDDRAEDDVRVFVRRLLNDRRRLADFDQREIRSTGDVDDDARANR